MRIDATLASLAAPALAQNAPAVRTDLGISFRSESYERFVASLRFLGDAPAPTPQKTG